MLCCAQGEIHEIIQLGVEQKPSVVISPVFIKVDVLASPSSVYLFIYFFALVKVLLLLL